MWSYDITQVDQPPGLIGGYIVRGEQYKMCRFDAKGILRSYKWKAGIIGGDSREDSDEDTSKKKTRFAEEHSQQQVAILTNEVA